MQGQRTTLSDDEFAALYPTTPNPELVQMLGVSAATVIRRARALGLHKDEAARYAHTRRPKSEATRAKMSAAQKGRTFSDESRAKMSASRMGRIITPQWRANISAGSKGKAKPAGFAQKALGRRLSAQERQARYDRMVARGTLSKGPKHYNWKGGLAQRPFLRYSDRRHRLWRDAVLRRDKLTCQQCGRVFIPGQRGLHAHHLKPYALYVDVRYDPDNGITLCTRCHRSYHSFVQVEAYERMDMVACACGCGEMMYPISADGRPRRYLRWHSGRGKTLSQHTRAKISATLTGRKRGPLSEEHRRKISESRKANRPRRAPS